MKTRFLMIALCCLFAMLLPTNSLAQEAELPEMPEYNYQITVQMPDDLSGDIVMDSIEGNITDTITQFVSEYFEWGIDPGIEDIELPPWSLDINVSYSNFTDNIVSVLVHTWQYSGGAHGNSFLTSFLFDTTSNQVLGWDDLFAEEFNPLWTIEPIVHASLMEQFGLEGEIDQWILDGTNMNPDNYQVYTLDSDEIVFYFQPYQVAPYATGIPEVHIPLSDMEAILGPVFYQAITTTG